MSKEVKRNEDELAFMRYADSYIPQEETSTPWYKSWPTAALKGLIEGGISLGEAISPTGELSERAQQKSEREQLYKEHLPSTEEFVPTAIEKAAKIVPGLAAGGGGVGRTLLRAGLAGASGAAVKEMGGSETAQNLAELPALIGPDLAKKIPHRLFGKTTSEQQKLAQFARSKGLAESDIALTAPNRGWLRDFFVDTSAKGGRTARAFEQTKDNLGRLWNDIRQSPAAQQSLNQQQATTFLNEVSKVAQQLPREQRKRVAQDAVDLAKSQFKGEDLINFWQDLNYYIARGEKGLGRLKEPINNALKNISPELAQDFALTNQMYGNFSNLVQRMRPDLVEHLIVAGERGALIAGIVTADQGLLTKVLGAAGGRLLAREMVINPRLQNLSSRFVNALEQGSPAVIKKVYDQIINEVGEKNAEAALELKDYDIDEFIKMLPSEKSSKEEGKK